MSKYPDCFPENFERDILPKGAKPVNRHVYRLIKSGKIDRSGFLSTFEEVKSGAVPPPKRGLDLSAPETYSTSCFEDYQDIEYLLDIFMRHYPRVFVAEGETHASCGPSQRTSERRKKEDSHVDWWIYNDAEPHKFFKEVK